MGKKSKFKKIRRLASELPKMTRASEKVEQVSGAEVIASGVKEINGAPVNPNGHYRKKQPVRAPLNHNKHMKRLYYQQGEKGVQNYVNAVHEFVAQKQQEKKAEQ